MGAAVVVVSGRVNGVFRWLFVGTGIASLANGGWMLVAARGWFVTIPAAMCDTGGPNVHLIHDLGVVFSIVGLAALATAWRPVANRAGG